MIRDYRKGDEARVQEIVAAALAEYGLTFEPNGTDGDLNDIGASYVANGGVFRVLELDGVVVGSYGLFNSGDGTTELRKMYLARECRGKGFGRKLLDDALALARRMGFHAVTLESNSKLKEALAMYRKYGFRETPRTHPVPRCDLAMRFDL